MDHSLPEDNLIIATKQTYDVLLRQKHPGDLIALLNFYIYTAKWQKTSRPKASTGFAAKGLGWGEEKVRTAKKMLIKLGFIEDARTVNEQGKVVGWYVRVKLPLYLNENHPAEKPEGGENQRVDEPRCGSSHRVENPETNALRANRLNALRSGTKTKAARSAAGKKPEESILTGEQWQTLIDGFEPVNPMYRDFYKNTTERAALESLAKTIGFEKLKATIEHLEEVTSQPYAPKITKPTELKRDLGRLIAHVRQRKKQGTGGVATLSHSPAPP